ncbi:hypothetical protein C2G38_291354 [Gigaspora rosea]|uniref:Uncharacterized protein n=1 Tax=Gigaspora rosea TaxID=44941 RepID=A0A397VZ25_9GLOM|nr:hypothetical protein C2G38_291354 [Gigaspora rosea]
MTPSNLNVDKCTRCMRHNISPTWCQSCDIKEATTGWTSGNKIIDELIKRYQINTTGYDAMIEWIPFNRLNNVQKVREEETEMIFMAFWLDGIRVIKSELTDTQSYIYIRSRIESCGVKLIMIKSELDECTHSLSCIESCIVNHKTLYNSPISDILLKVLQII